MKRILFLLLILSFLRISAQHSDLQNRKWYLSNFTIDNNYVEPLYDPLSFPYVILEFWSGGFSYSTNQIVGVDCEIGFTGHVNFTSNDVFEFIDYSPYSNSNNCTSYTIDFMNQYVSFFENYISEIFTYDITDETNGSKSLIITNQNGDEVNFTDTYLNIAPEGMYETWWYLHSLNIDGTEYIPPINEELPNVPMSFHEPDYNFVTQGCLDFMWADANFHTDTSMIYLYNLFVEFNGCTNNENDDFQNIYFGFYWKGNSLPQAYGYTYTDNGSEKTLVLTDTNDNVGIYKNWTLATEELNDTHFTLFPNPITAILYIENATETIDKIEVLDITGRTVIIKKKDFTQIDFSNFRSGVYFVKFYAGEAVFTKKVIKE